VSVLIVVSTLTEAMTSLPIFHVNYTESELKIIKKAGEFLNWDESSYEKMTTMKPQPYLKLADIVCHSVITLEFIISLVVCHNKITYVFDFSRICLTIGYFSFWLKLILQLEEISLKSDIAIKMITVFAYLTVLKLARLFYLAKHIPAFYVIRLTMSSSKTELKILMAILAILICVFGTLIYYAEYPNSKISNVFIGMYWALITVTTVGYGDYTPQSVAGHVIAGACASCGVLILALPIGVIASSFYTFYNCNKYGTKHYDHIKVRHN
jgi:potassium voltage-gated channel Shaw-related subfamily C protein